MILPPKTVRLLIPLSYWKYFVKNLILEKYSNKFEGLILLRFQKIYCFSNHYLFLPVKYTKIEEFVEIIRFRWEGFF